MHTLMVRNKVTLTKLMNFYLPQEKTKSKLNVLQVALLKAVLVKL